MSAPTRYTLPPGEKPPADDALHPMAFLVEKGPGAVTRPHFHQADQFQVVVAGRGMLGDHEFSDGAVHYTDAYSAYGPIVAGKSGIWWFTLRNRWDPGARYMPAEREVLNAARNRHQHRELTTRNCQRLSIRRPRVGYSVGWLSTLAIGFPSGIPSTPSVLSQSMRGGVSSRSS
jgi:hypothetical protein